MTAVSFTLRVRRSITAVSLRRAFGGHRPPLQKQLLAAIDTARSWRFMHDDLTESGAKRLQLLPEPGRHVFDRWVLQAGNFVEIGMIELLQNRFHRGADFGVIV